MNWLYMPLWSTRVIAVVAIALVLLALFRWWRERRGGWLVVARVALTVLLLAVLLNPEALLPRERSGKRKMVVLIDTSASMATPDVNGEARLMAALRALTNAATLTALQKEFALDFRSFDREARPAEIAALKVDDARGDASDLGAALMAAVSDLAESSSQAGVLVISDGRATAEGALDAAQVALARTVPIWACGVGGTVPQYDLSIETPSTEALAFSGAEVELGATLRAVGYPHRSFNVELVRDDKVIETKQSIPGSNGVARITAKVKAPDSGEERYVFRVAGQPEEADTANNERALFLRAVGSKVRVLLAEGQPHWDTKFLVQSLKREPQVDLTAVYRLNADRHLSVVSATGTESRVEQDLFPRTPEAVNNFDVIILGRGAEVFVDSTTEALLTDFVSRRAGSLVFARGKAYGGRFQALAKLEPVAWGSGAMPSVRLRPTDAGRNNPIFDLGATGNLDDVLERLPALDQASVTLGEKPLAVVLASAGAVEGPVLLSYQRYGQGKTINLNATGLWRWSFRETGQEESEMAYRRFWVSLMQWLISGSQFLPGSDVALTTSRRYYNSEQPIQFLISTRNLDRSIYRPRLVISGPKQTLELEPRPRGEGFVAEAGPFAQGSYRISLHSNIGQPAELSQTIEVLSASVEKKELSADRETMRQLAQISGGAVVSTEELAQMPRVLQRWDASRQLAHRREPIWDKWWVLGCMLGLLGIEWWQRRREGLL